MGFVKNERNILNLVDNDYVIWGIYTFHSEKFLYMVMEYMQGGDLGHVLKDLRCLTDQSTKYYLVQLILAIEYIHSQGIIHCDLKPDNLLINVDGCIKLTDFGLSQCNNEKLAYKYKRFWEGGLFNDFTEDDEEEK
jgi:serine/threonine protein kinase